MESDELMRVLAAFERHGLAYVLIGATAMGFHGLVRATEDVDLFVQAEAVNLSRLRAALHDAYPDDPNVDDISDADLLGEYPAVRYYPARGDLYFDILTRLGEAASFESVERETKVIDGVRVMVATPAALYRLERDTVRAIDRQDAEALSTAFHNYGDIRPPMHPAARRCSFLEYTGHSRSSRLAGRAPRHPNTSP